MELERHPCSECAFYLAPSWWKRFREAMFAPRCTHPAHRDEVDGSPKPCVTMRIMDCSGRMGTYSPDKFRPRNADSATANAGEST